MNSDLSRFTRAPDACRASSVIKWVWHVGVAKTHRLAVLLKQAMQVVLNQQVEGDERRAGWGQLLAPTPPRPWGARWSRVGLDELEVRPDESIVMLHPFHLKLVSRVSAFVRVT